MAWISTSPEAWCAPRSIWVTSPVMTALRPVPEAGQEHLHLADRRVLRLIQDDEGAVQRTPAHVGERGHLDDAEVEEAADLLVGEEVVERVVERPQVGIDLLLHVAREEPEILAGLHGGPDEENPLHLPRLERVHRGRDGEVGLPGSSRTDREHDVVFLERGDVSGLPQRLDTDRALVEREEDRALVELHRRVSIALVVDSDEIVDVVLLQNGAFPHELGQRAQDRAHFVHG